MRLIIATAGIALLASSGSAMAADCTKGLLWPYVRNPGDCLTSTEIQAGKTGVYSGPATGQVDVSTIKPPSQAVSNSTPCSHSWYWPFGGDSCASAQSANVSDSPGFGATASNPAVKDSSPATQPAAAAPAGGPRAALQQPAQPPAVMVLAAAPAQLAQARTADCHKGILWPFIRDAGDCSTPAEVKGQPPAAYVAPAPPSASVTPVAAVASPPPAAMCTKGTFWPFIREAGDCATAAEKSSGNVSSAPAAPSAPAATPVAAAAAPPPATVTQAVVVASPPAVTCIKGTFWPFIRGAGDCLTASEKASGQTSPVAATAPEQTEPVPAAAPPVSNPGACHKGLFWPFVREDGDCPTGADRTPQR